MNEKHEQLATLRQIAEESQLPISWFYQRSRRGALPGLRRFGRHCRVDRREFSQALKEGLVR